MLYSLKKGTESTASAIKRYKTPFDPIFLKRSVEMKTRKVIPAIIHAVRLLVSKRAASIEINIRTSTALHFRLLPVIIKTPNKGSKADNKAP